MEINESVIQNDEKLVLTLRSLYASYGYVPYKMSKFEEYDFYAKNKDFLVSDNVITFTDTNGKLMALKPDVTLSIIKNRKDEPDKLQKVFYNENVYRVSKGNNSFGEIMQTGLECFGPVGNDSVCEVITLAVRSMDTFSKDYVLDISNLSLVENAISGLGLSKEDQNLMYKAVSEKNEHELRRICADNDVPESAADELVSLVSVCGKLGDVLKNKSVFGTSETASDFISILEKLNGSELAERIQIDFSVTDDANYYNGIVFKGYVQGIPNAVLSGGQYDKLMKKMHRKSGAIGFAVYIDLLERIDSVSDLGSSDGMVNIALPKGRLGEKIYDMFARAGFECPSILEPNRKLIFENPEKGVRYFWVKPSDVAIYVERGAADIGVAGKDILLEYNPDVFELLDMKKGKCRMAVAAPKTFVDDQSKTLRVATKFSNIAKEFYVSQGRDIDIIHLNGSIEIAPILGLSDVIVDIVETGKTLKENDLEVFETILPISARLIANKSSYRFKSEQIDRIAKELAVVTEEDQ